MSTVIAAIAGSDATRPVMIMARAVAHALDASVEALHVKEGNGEAELTAAAGAPVRVLSGDPVEVLPLVAAEQDVLALVVGARSQPGSPRRVGDLARSLADRTDKPVVVVPLGYRPPERLHTVVVAMEGSPGKARALQRSIAISARAGLEIVVVHVQDEDSIPSFSDQVQHEAEEYAEGVLLPASDRRAENAARAPHRDARQRSPRRHRVVARRFGRRGLAAHR